MFLGLVILLVAAILVYDYLSKKERNDAIRNISGPPAYPVIGTILNFVGKSPEEILSVIFENRRKYGPVYRMWIFNRLNIVTFDAKDVEAVLSSSTNITKHSLYDLLIGWLGDGLFLSTGQKWHTMRKLITPTFHFKILEQFVDTFDNQSKELISLIRPKADGKTPVNIHPFVGRMALDVIAETSMGIPIHAQRNPHVGYPLDIESLTSLVANRFLMGYQRKEFLFRLFAPRTYFRQQRITKRLHQFTENVIEQRRKILEKELLAGQRNEADPSDDIGSKRKMALLDVLLQSTVNGKPLSNIDIRQEVDNFMFAGHDTTAASISHTLYLLARHPEIQQKALEEVREVIGDDIDAPVSLRILNNLRYLDCVIKESLRILPVVPFIGRRIGEAIEINGKYVPAGSDFSIGMYILMRDPAYFPNPDDFIPERHLVENTTEKINPYAFIPFSAGPRNCVGQKYAILEMKCAIAKILLSYELLPLGERVRPMMTLITKSASGVQLGLKPRVL